MLSVFYIALDIAWEWSGPFMAYLFLQEIHMPPTVNLTKREIQYRQKSSMLIGKATNDRAVPKT